MKKRVRNKKPSHKKKNKKISLIVTVLIAAFTATVIIVSSRNFADAAENKKNLKDVSKKYETACSENDKLESFLDDENHDEYIEKIAREQYDYVRPGEKVYFNSSSGK